jgi:hypothetical protein
LNHNRQAQSRAGINTNMHASAPIGIESDAYHHAVSKLEAIARSFDPAAPFCLRSTIIQVLGEDLGLWPEDCLNEQEAMTPRLAA